MESEITNLTQIQNTTSTIKACLLYFYSDNCAPCISLRPKVREMIENDFPKMQLFFANSENYPEISAAYGVYANPTILVFFDGKEYLRKSKYVSVSELNQDIERLYNMVFS
jgi:thioredoxin 1